MLDVFFHFLENTREFRKNFTHQEFLLQWESFHILDNLVAELWWNVKEDVVIAEKAVLSQIVSDLVIFLVLRLLIEVISDPYTSTNNEIHFEYLFFFVVDNIPAILCRELAWIQTKCNFVKEFGVCMLLGVKEDAEVVENVIEKIVDYDSTLDGPWKSVHKFIFRLNLGQAVVSPIVREVVIYLVV